MDIEPDADGIEPLYKRFNPLEEANKVTLEVMRVTEEESHSHPPGSWAKEGAIRHFIHAAAHMAVVYDRLCGPFGDDRTPLEEEFLEEARHAKCRLDMAFWSLAHGLDGDYGEEGGGS